MLSAMSMKKSGVSADESALSSRKVTGQSDGTVEEGTDPNTMMNSGSRDRRADSINDDGFGDQSTDRSSLNDEDVLKFLQSKQDECQREFRDLEYRVQKRQQTQEKLRRRIREDLKLLAQERREYDSDVKRFTSLLLERARLKAAHEQFIATCDAYQRSIDIIRAKKQEIESVIETVAKCTRESQRLCKEHQLRQRSERLYAVRRDAQAAMDNVLKWYNVLGDLECIRHHRLTALVQRVMRVS